MTTNEVAWAPGAGPYGPPAGWPPPARPGPDPATLLRTAAGGLAVVAGALTVGGSFPTMMATRSEDFDGGTSTTTFSGWGNTSESRGDGPGRELLLGIPLGLVAAALVVAGALLLLSARRPSGRARALTATVGAVAAATGVFWLLSSMLSDWTRFYRELEIDGLSAARGPGYWLVLTGFVLALLALAGVLVAALLDSPRRRARAAAAPPVAYAGPYAPAPAAPAPYAPGPHAAPGQWPHAPTAPPAWPAPGQPAGGPAPSPWGETR